MRLAACVLLLAVLGCGGNYNDGLNRGGELSGTAYLDDKPLGGGRVECFSADGRYSVAANIDPRGRYTLKEPPLGPCKLVVKTSHLKDSASAGKGGKGNPGGSAGMVIPDDVGLKYTPIPAKYEELNSTDLAVTVEKGDQSHDIRLKN